MLLGLSEQFVKKRSRDGVPLRVIDDVGSVPKVE